MIEVVLVIIIIAVFFSMGVLYYISNPPPPPDKYNLFVTDKHQDHTGGISGSDNYYVAGYVNNTKIVLHLEDVKDYMKTEENKTNIYECNHNVKHLW